VPVESGGKKKSYFVPKINVSSKTWHWVADICTLFMRLAISTYPLGIGGAPKCACEPTRKVQAALFVVPVNI
jgi:hypothetical protein